MLECDALGGLIDELAGGRRVGRAQLPGIKPERAGVILAGAVVIAAAMEAAGASASK